MIRRKALFLFIWGGGRCLINFVKVHWRGVDPLEIFAASRRNLLHAGLPVEGVAADAGALVSPGLADAHPTHSAGVVDAGIHGNALPVRASITWRCKKQRKNPRVCQKNHIQVRTNSPNWTNLVRILNTEGLITPSRNAKAILNKKNFILWTKIGKVIIIHSTEYRVQGSGVKWFQWISGIGRFIIHSTEYRVVVWNSFSGSVE